MGKVTVYYTLHSGNPFEDPRFLKAFRKADVVDFESAGGVTRQKMNDLRAISRGDGEAYNRMFNAYAASYAATHDPADLYRMSVVKTLFGSGKKVEFEEKLPRGSRSRYRARMYRQFPILKELAYPSGRRRLVEEGVKKDGEWGREILKEYYEAARVLEIPAMIRSFADSERIARKARLYPAHRLVVRGEAHLPMTQFLKRKGADVRNVVMAGGETLHRRLLAGHKPSANEVFESYFKHAVFDAAVKELGAKAHEAAGLAGMKRRRKK